MDPALQWGSGWRSERVSPIKIDAFASWLAARNLADDLAINRMFSEGTRLTYCCQCPGMLFERLFSCGDSKPFSGHFGCMRIRNESGHVFSPTLVETKRSILQTLRSGNLVRNVPEQISMSQKRKAPLPGLFCGFAFLCLAQRHSRPLSGGKVGIKPLGCCAHKDHHRVGRYVCQSASGCIRWSVSSINNSSVSISVISFSLRNNSDTSVHPAI